MRLLMDSRVPCRSPSGVGGSHRPAAGAHRLRFDLYRNLPHLGTVAVFPGFLAVSCCVGRPERSGTYRPTCSTYSPQPGSHHTTDGARPAQRPEATHNAAVSTNLLAYAPVLALVDLTSSLHSYLSRARFFGLVAWILAGVTLLDAAATWVASAVARVAGLSHAAIITGGGVLLAAAPWGLGRAARRWSRSATP